MEEGSPVRQGISEEWEEIFCNEDGVILVVENYVGLNTPHTIEGILLKIPDGEKINSFSSILQKIEIKEEEVWVLIAPGHKRKVHRKYLQEWSYFHLFATCSEDFGFYGERYSRILEHLKSSE